jgi:tRNA (guanosine-2'-O-)-methyltransferase
LREAVRHRTRAVCVVLDGVHDPHNLSAAVRSCDAFGVSDLHVVESQARFRCRKKISLGAQKWVQVHRHRSAELCLAGLQKAGYQLWVADPRPGSTAVDELPWEGRVALAFGNERSGVGPEMRKAAAGSFFIPMYGLTESFNLSVATGITLAIGVRERLRRTGRHGDLNEQEQAELLARWYRRSVKRSDQILKGLSKAAPNSEGENAQRQCQR